MILGGKSAAFDYYLVCEDSSLLVFLQCLLLRLFFSPQAIRGRSAAWKTTTMMSSLRRRLGDSYCFDGGVRGKPFAVYLYLAAGLIASLKAPGSIPVLRIYFSIVFGHWNKLVANLFFSTK
jgi:hypothetical protein